jgi:hypothetical protein
MTNRIQEIVGDAEAFDLSNNVINALVAEYVIERGPVGTGKYACTCNNWGPRWGENSLTGCCDGCFKWSLNHHQEMSVNGVKPPTRKMITENTWGIYVPNLDKERESRDYAIVRRQSLRDRKDYMRSLKD